MRKFIISGRGVISIFGKGVLQLWEGILAKEKILKELSNNSIKGKIEDEKISLSIKEEKRKLDRLSLYAIECVKMALEDAGLDISMVDKHRLAVIFSTYHGGIIINYKEINKLLLQGPSYISPFWFPMTTYNFPVGAIARYFNLTNAINTCLVGCFPLWYGVYVLQQGLADIVILVSSDEFFGGFDYFFVQNKLSKTVMTTQYPLEEGIIYSEAWCAIIVETKENVIKRGGKIYGEISQTFEITNPFLNSGSNSQRFYKNFSFIDEYDEMCKFLTCEINEENCLWIGTANGIPESLYDEFSFINNILLKKASANLFYTNIKGHIGESFSPSLLLNLIVATEIFENKIIPGMGKISHKTQQYISNNFIPIEENTKNDIKVVISAAVLPNGLGNLCIIKNKKL